MAQRPSGRWRARSSFAQRRVVSSSRRRMNSRKKRCWAVMVTFESSSLATVVLIPSRSRHGPRATRAPERNTLESGWWAGVPQGRGAVSRFHSRMLAGAKEADSGRAAADGAFHRRRPAGVRPRAGAYDVRPRRDGPRPQGGGAGARREGGGGLAAHARPEELGRAEPRGELARHQVDEGPPAHREELRRPARDDGEVLPALRLAAGEPAAVEDPVRGAAEERGELVLEQP